MNEIYLIVLDIIKGMWRYKWYAIVSMWAVAAILWAAVFSMPNYYTVESRLYVDTDTVLTPLLKGLTVNTNVTNRIHLMTLALLSKPNLEKIANETDLSLNSSTPEELEAITAKLAEDINISKARGEDLFDVSYSSGDSELSYRVVEILVNSLVEDTMGSSKEDSAVAKQFLEKNIKEYEDRLVASENRLAAFKKKYIGQMPGDGDNYYAQLQRLTAEGEIIRQQLSIAVARRNELRRQLEGEEPTLGIMGEGSAVTAPTPYDLKITEIEQTLAQLSLKYTDQHPEVILLRDTLVDLQAKKKQHLKTNTKANAFAHYNALDSNPVYQAMRVAVSEAGVEVKALSAQYAQHKRVVSDLQMQVNEIPGVEAELSRLNRDYEITKNKYEDLASRLETANLSQNADNTSDDVKFKIINPPTIPLQPTGPERSLFLLAALLASIGSGVALAFLLNLIKPVFNNSSSLKSALGLPVFGVITEKVDGVDLALRRTQAFAVVAAFASLLVVGAFVLYFQKIPLTLVQGIVG